MNFEIITCQLCFMAWPTGSGGCVQAESVRRAEEERMKQEVKDATLRAAKERLERLQSTWREDQQLKEVCIHTPAVPPTCSAAYAFAVNWQGPCLLLVFYLVESDQELLTIRESKQMLVILSA